MFQKQGDPLWWERDDLHYNEGRLEFAGKDVNRIADGLGVPIEDWIPE